jgi:hypothetical protein
MFIFEGKKTLFAYKDPSTGAHADLKEVVSIATDGMADVSNIPSKSSKDDKDCGCDN